MNSIEYLQHVTFNCKFDIKLNYRISMCKDEKTNTQNNKMMVDV